MCKRNLILSVSIAFFFFVNDTALAQQQTHPVTDSITLPLFDLITATLLTEFEYSFDVEQPLSESYELLGDIPNRNLSLIFDNETQMILGTPSQLGTSPVIIHLNDGESGDYLGMSQTMLTVVVPEYELPSRDWSIARQWNEILLQSIREDFARPTVHARNLFHLSAAMYDAWAVYEDADATALYKLGGSDADGCNFRYANVNGMNASQIEAARHKTISHAAYVILWHRFSRVPNRDLTLNRFEAMMESFEYDVEEGAINRNGVSPAGLLGERIGWCYINSGLEDEAKEELGYNNVFYKPINPPMVMSEPYTDTAELVDPNRWQPLSFALFIGQSGISRPGLVTDFVGAEWGAVKPFALNQSEQTKYERDGNTYFIYDDPGAPPYLDTETADDYRWGFTLVPKWAALLDPDDEAMINISPAVIGNNPVTAYPETLNGLRDFYSPDGGDTTSQGHALNPHTGEPYTPNIVNRADYARVIAEFWADGPDSETPPGHWFTLLNELNEHPDLIKKWGGNGKTMGDLEWDVRAYFVLGGTMHDTAVSVWGLKGYYDYVRPVSAIRYMGSRGQSSDPSADYYSEHGLAIEPGFAEIILPDDLLAGENGEHVGKMKLYTWLGPDAIEDPETDVAGVGWVLAEAWWPYQRPTFVTPPFAGYVSGHSTFSRSAAEVLTFMTGDPYFPGGMGEFVAPKNEFLVFEEGPSEDVVLQWATYQDAADQSAISRIWGGIHPPADDIPGRLMGIEIGRNAFDHAAELFDLPTPSPTPIVTSTPTPAVPITVALPPTPAPSTSTSGMSDQRRWIIPVLAVSIITVGLGGVWYGWQKRS